MNHVLRMLRMWRWLTDRHHNDHPFSSHTPRTGFHWDERACRDLDTLLATEARRNNRERRVDKPSGMDWEDPDDD